MKTALSVRNVSRISFSDIVFPYKFIRIKYSIVNDNNADIGVIF